MSSKLFFILFAGPGTVGLAGCGGRFGIPALFGIFEGIFGVNMGVGRHNAARTFILLGFIFTAQAEKTVEYLTQCAFPVSVLRSHTLPGFRVTLFFKDTKKSGDVQAVLRYKWHFQR